MEKSKNIPNNIYFLKENKYLRIKVEKYHCCFISSLSVAKRCKCCNTVRFYEVNNKSFHINDYSNENEVLKQAIKWAENECKYFQDKLVKSMEDIKC